MKNVADTDRAILIVFDYYFVWFILFILSIVINYVINVVNS